MHASANLLKILQMCPGLFWLIHVKFHLVPQKKLLFLLHFFLLDSGDITSTFLSFDAGPVPHNTSLHSPQTTTCPPIYFFSAQEKLSWILFSNQKLVKLTAESERPGQIKVTKNIWAEKVWLVCMSQTQKVWYSYSYIHEVTLTLTDSNDEDF